MSSQTSSTRGNPSAKGKPSPKGTNWSLGAAFGAATLASACCTIPLALVSLGVGGAWIAGLTALAPYRWLFVALAMGALVYAGYNEWRMSRRPDCDCETALSPAARRSVLGLGALAVVALVVSPWLLASSPASATQSAAQAHSAKAPEPASASEPANAAAAPVSFQQAVLTVEGMTCASCTVTVQRALESVEGVYGAEVTYEPARAVVRFDPAQVRIENLTQATKDAGYPARPKTSS